MAEDGERAARYREHARKVRDIAVDVKKVETRRKLEEIALEWDRMADAAEGKAP